MCKPPPLQGDCCQQLGDPEGAAQMYGESIEHLRACPQPTAEVCALFCHQLTFIPPYLSYLFAKSYAAENPP